MTNPNDVNDVLELMKPEILNVSGRDLHCQLELIGSELHRKLNPNLNTFNPIASNIKHLMMLDAISKNNTVDDDVLSKYFNEKLTGGNETRFYYDEYGMVLLSMFNSYFIYPFDSVYDISGGYKLDRSEGLDFSKLDLTMFDVIYINIDETPLNNLKDGLDSIVNKQVRISKKILEQKNNLSKVRGNQLAEKNINDNIKSLNSSLALLITEYMKQNAEYSLVLEDFVNNKMYFRNKAIIEGVRNSIAHGNYEILAGKSFDDTLIVFKDIYEGKLTFQAKIKFVDFEKLFDVNTACLVKFIDDKIGLASGVSLKRK